MDSNAVAARSPAGAPPRTSPQAVWSLVLGILSNTCLWLLGSIPAIILGIVAINHINRNPGQVGGKGLAIAGIATGGAGVLVGILIPGIVASIALPAFTSMSGRAHLTKQSSDIRQLIVACHRHAEDSGGELPPSLDVLLERGYVDDPALLLADNPATGTSEPFIYVPGVTLEGPPKPLILGPGWLGGKRAVGFSDGRIEVFSRARWEREIEP